MADPVVRVAKVQDLDGIQALFDQGDAYHAELLPHVFRAVERGRPDEIIESSITADDSDILVAVEGPRVVGFLDIKESKRPEFPIFYPKRFAVVENMVVDEHRRGLGIGTRLLDEAKAWAKARDLDAVQLTVWSKNHAAIGLYEDLGFETFIERMELDLYGEDEDGGGSGPEGGKEKVEP